MVPLRRFSIVSEGVSGLKTSPVRRARAKLFFEWRVDSFLNVGSRSPLRLPQTILEKSQHGRPDEVKITSASSHLWCSHFGCWRIVLGAGCALEMLPKERKLREFTRLEVACRRV